ncbi:hypothetical protein [Streptacidiphilus fuscans]|uniref:Uncharacterized protein n=1 Tax=Streptacidiphilus fuscans TaxID=2789292 RepID=A0A931B332_9ACTN|nr:hypothetical protein [Streptacidiphilus fuscans]MBF9068392.1 hypothetical protein [Streptacidiphilus fuscans]
MAKVEVRARRALAFVVVAGAVVGALPTLAGCMEVGPATAPTGAGVPTAAPAGVGGSQDGVATPTEQPRHRGGDRPSAGPGVSAPAGSPTPGARPSGTPSPQLGGQPVVVTPLPSTSGVRPTLTPPSQPSPSPSRVQPSTPPPTTSPPPTPSPSPPSPSATASGAALRA